MTVAVTDGDKGLEPRALTGARLLLDGHNLQNLVLQAGEWGGRKGTLVVAKMRSLFMQETIASVK